MPLIQMFDKQLNVRMGQANVKRWTEDILPLLSGDDDPLGVDDFATHHLPLEHHTPTRSSKRRKMEPSRSRYSPSATRRLAARNPERYT